MATNKNSKGQVTTVAKQLIAGVEKHLTSTTQVALLGSTFTAPQITSKLQSLVTLRADVNASKATTKAKIANETAQLPALRAFISALESYVKAAFGSSPDVGTKQKKAIKGDVTGVLVTPITASSNVTPPSGPTAPATSTGPTAASRPIETTAPAASGSNVSTVAAATPRPA